MRRPFGHFQLIFKFIKQEASLATQSENSQQYGAPALSMALDLALALSADVARAACPFNGILWRRNWPTPHPRLRVSARWPKPNKQPDNRATDDRQSVSVAADRCGEFRFGLDLYGDLADNLSIARPALLC